MVGSFQTSCSVIMAHDLPFYQVPSVTIILLLVLFRCCRCYALDSMAHYYSLSLAMLLRTYIWIMVIGTAHAIAVPSSDSSGDVASTSNSTQPIATISDNAPKQTHATRHHATITDARSSHTAPIGARISQGQGAPHPTFTYQITNSEEPHFCATSNGWGVSTFEGPGKTYTLCIDSFGPVLGGKTLATGQTTLFEGKTWSVNVFHDPYVNGERLISWTKPAPTWQLGPGIPFTVSDEALGTQIFTAYTDPRHFDRIVAAGVTLTRGAEPGYIDMFYRVSLDTDGVMYTLPIPRATYSSSESLTSSTAIQSTPTEALSTASVDDPLSAEANSAARCLLDFAATMAMVLFMAVMGTL